MKCHRCGKELTVVFDPASGKRVTCEFPGGIIDRRNGQLIVAFIEHDQRTCTKSLANNAIADAFRKARKIGKGGG